jgi:type IV pilus assembly protein PilN
MIKINLLREKKRLKKAPKGQNAFAVGMMALGGAAALVYFFVHAPLSDQVTAQKGANEKVRRSNAQMAEETKDFETVNQQYQALLDQEEAIKRLNDARAVPAWLLRELSSILTKGHQPTMTQEMTERVKTDPNRQWNLAWDPKRLWIMGFTEKGGEFTLTGGAQSDTDVTQLALRLQASVFFTEVVPEGGATTTDQQTKVQYYTFTMKGKVVY